MNHELIMLRGANRMKYYAKSVSQEIMRIAVSSYSTMNYKNGTMGQVEAICQRAKVRDNCLLFYNALIDGLRRIPKGNRALLVAVYLKNADKSAICAKYKVSSSTLYRKLFVSRSLLRAELDALGYDEQWFRENFGYIDWIAEMLDSNEVKDK